VRKIALLVATCALLSAFLPQATASTPTSITTTHLQLPWSDDFKTCSGETILFSGVRGVTVHRSLFADGSYHVSVSSVWLHAVAVSESGVTYRLILDGQGTSAAKVRVDGGYMYINGWGDQLILISENGDGNWLVKDGYHITLHPSGEVTGEVNIYVNKCLG
jgi:hypothetical protein